MEREHEESDVSVFYEMVSRRLKEERKKQKLSVSDLERRSGVDRTSIHKMETNRIKFGLPNLIRLCEALGMRLYDLYDLYEDDEKLDLKKRIDELDDEECQRVKRIVLTILGNRRLKAE